MPRRYIQSGHAKKLMGQELEKHRKKFQNPALKERLRKEWEKNTGKKWPTHPKNLKNKNGTPSRLAGQPYEAHHVIPQSLNGPHDWRNITPVHTDAHRRMIHGSTGAIKEIMDIVTKSAKQ